MGREGTGSTSSARVRPLDPRLLRHAASARPYVVLTAGLGTLTAGVVVAQAVLLAGTVADVVGGAPLDGAAVAALGGLVLLRAVLARVQERYGHRAATAVVAELRAACVRRLAATEPFRAGTTSSAAVTTLLTRGLDSLDGYLARYLPQLLLTCTATPAVLAVIWWQDTLAGLTVLVTLPLVPLFMALVGMSSQALADRRLRSLQALGGQVLDLVAGLPTLLAHRRASAQTARVREAGDAHRRATMGTLRAAFLSALVLETLTTLCVALVAVGVGLRLVHGSLDLGTGLLVLVLAPEAYLPLRMVGAQFHAATDGLAAFGRALEILERLLPQTGSAPAPDLRTARIRLDGVTVVHPGGRVAPVGASGELRPGEVVAVTGASGTGKSTLVSVLLGLRRPDAGSVRVIADPAAPVDLADIDPESWWAQVAWVPQQPQLVPGTIAENALAGSGLRRPSELLAVAALTGLDGVVATLPNGWDTPVGRGGTGLSAGQRQRVALTRALLGRAQLVVLDEPGAHLDAASEAMVAGAVEALREAGRTVVLVSHRASLTALADRMLEVRAGTATASEHGPAGPFPIAPDGSAEPRSSTGRIVAAAVPA